MKFLLIDKIDSIEPGKKIETHKNLTLAEEYLGDHFPSYPIMPGVLMIEGMTQSAAWLVRLEQDFANSIVVLKAVRNAKYAFSLRPGCTMRYEITLKSIDEEKKIAKFIGSGYCGDRLAVSAKLELTWDNMSHKGEFGKDIDCRLTKEIKQNFELLGGPQALEAAKSAE